MPNYTIEMLWDCEDTESCKQKRIKGLCKHCPNCGRPKSEKSFEYMPDDITEANAIQENDHRPDWKCKYCGSLQGATNECCTECGVDKKTGAKKWEFDQVTVTENADGAGRHETSRHVEVDHDSAYDANPPVTQELIDQLKRIQPAERSRWIRNTIIGFVILSILIGGWWLLRTRELNSGVRSVHWTHTIIVERYQLNPHDGWSVPYGAVNSRDVGPRYHHTDHRLVGHHDESYSDPQPCGQTCTTPSCYTTSRSCTSNGKGTASCSGGDKVCPSPVCNTKYCPHTSYRSVPDYEDFPISQEYYSWQEWEWTHNRNVVHAGSTTETTWPSDAEIHLMTRSDSGESERSSQSASYEVILGHHGELWHFIPQTDDEFRIYSIGSRHQIRVNHLGMVTVLKHGRF